MKIKNKNIIVAMGSAAIVGLPMAVAASCGTSSNNNNYQPIQPVSVNAVAKNLERVTVSGDTSHPVFTVPAELTNINDNKELSASGKTAALRVYGRTNLTNLAGSGVTNHTFMPLKLLEYYLAGQLDYLQIGSETKLMAVVGTEKIDVNQRFGSLFGFNTENYKPKLLGKWDPKSFEVRYYPEQGYTTSSKDELEKIIAPNTDAVKTFFNFDEATLKTAFTATAFEYDPASTHDAVIWNKKPAVSNLPTEFGEAVSTFAYSPDSTGQSTTNDIPIDFVYEKLDRKLFVKLSPKENFVLAKSMIDVTEASQVQKIITKIDKFPGFLTNDLSKISIAVVPKKLSFAPHESGEIEISGEDKIVYPTEGALLQFQVGTSTTWISFGELVDTLTNTTTTTPLTIKAKFDTAGNTDFVIENNKLATITNNFVSIINTQKFIDDAALLQVDGATSSITQIQFKNVPQLAPELAALVESIEYLIGDYATPELANQATTWSTSLPVSIPMGPLKFYARLRAKNPSAHILSNMLIDLTQTSGIKSLLIATDASTVETALKAMRVTGQNVAPVWTKAPVAADFPNVQIDKIEYLVGNYATLAAAAVAEGWTSALPNTLDFVFAKRHLFARIFPKDGYRVQNEFIDLTATSQIQAVSSYYKFDAAILNSTLNNAFEFEFDATSTHANVIWTKKASYDTLLTDWKTAVTTIKFSTNADGSGATDAVPTSLAYDSAARGLYIVLVPGNNITLSQTIVDVTKGSGVKQIRTKIDAAPNYSTIDLSTAKLEINALKPVTAPAASGELILTPPTSVTLPTGAEIKYTIGSNTTVFTAPELIKEIMKLAPASALVIKAQLVVTDNAKYVIENNKAATINNALVAIANTNDFIATAASLKTVGNASLPSNVAFENIPALPSNLTAAVKKVEYLIGNYNTIALADNATTWTETVPTTATANTDKFYLRLTPNSGYILLNTITDLTTTSGLAALKTLVDVTTLETYLKGIKVSGTHNAPVFTPTSGIMPAISEIEKVEYLVGNYATIAEAKAAAGWTAVLPTSLLFNYSERYMFARIVPKASFIVTNEYLNLTATSEVQAVKGLIDAQPEYAAVNLATIKLTGNLNEVTFDTSSITLPSESEIKYQYDTGALMNQTDFKAQLLSLAGVITQADFSKIKAALVATDPIHYQINNPKTATVNASGLTDVASESAPTTVVTALANFKVSATSTAENVTWENLPPTDPKSAGYEFLSGDYATAAIAASAPASAWKTTLPTTVDYDPAKRFFYVRILPKPGYAFSGNLIDATTSSNVQTLLTNVTARHIAVRDLLKTITPEATALQNAVTWTGVDTSSYAPFFTIEYLYSTTVKTVADALIAPGYTTTLPTTVAYDHSARFMFARITLKTGMTTSETERVVDLTSIVRRVRSDVALSPSFAAMDLTKIEISGGLVNAIINTTPANILGMVRPIYTMTGITGFVSASEFLNYLQTNVATIQATDLSSIRVKLLLVNTTQFINTNEKLSTPTVSNLKLTTQVTIPAALRTAILAMRVTPTSSTFSVTWNPTIPSVAPYNNLTNGVARIEVAVGAYNTAQIVNDTLGAWKTSFPSDTIIYTPVSRRVWVRVVPMPGFEFIDADDAIIDISDSSNIKTLLNNATIEHTNLITSLNNITTTSSSTHDAVTWVTSSISSLPTFRVNYEFLSSTTVTTVAEAEATTETWGSTLPAAIDPVHSNRHLWAHIIIMVGGTSTNTNLYIDLSAKVQAIKTNVDKLANFDQIDLSKITIKNGLITAAIDESAVTLVDGVATSYAISGKTAYMTKAEFETHLRTNFATITTEDINNISVRLKNTDETKYVLSNLRAANPDVTGLSLLTTVDAPTSLIADLTALKVNATSDIGAITWNNALPTISGEVGVIEYLSGNYATLAEVTSAANNLWTPALPTTAVFDATKRFLYARLTPIAGYQLSTRIYDLTTTSEIRTLLQDVTTAHTALLAEIAKIVPAATATHLSATWTIPNLTSFTTGIEIEYLSSTTVKTITEAQSATTGWSTDLPTSLDYTHDARFLFARVSLKSGFKSSEVTYFVNLTGAAQSVKTDLNQIVTSSTAAPTKIKMTGYYVDATLDESLLLLPSGVSILYDIVALNVTALTATQLITYLKDHVADITLAARNSITGYISFDAGKFVLTTVPRGLVDTATLKTPKPYDASALAYSLQETVLAPNSLVNALTWNNTVTTFSGFTTGVEYYIGAEALELDVALLTDSVWSSTLPTTLPSSLLTTPENAHLWARIKSQAGYGATPIYVDLTPLSKISSAIKLIPQTVKDAFASALTDLMTHSASDLNTSVYYTIKSVDSELSKYAKIQFLQGDYATQAAAEAATSWVDHADYTPPISLVYTHENRPHVWARVINLSGFETAVQYVDLTPVIVDVKSDIANATNYQNYDLSKLVVVLNSEAAAPVIEETAIGLPRIPGAGYEFSYTQLDGVDVWLSEAAFIAEGANNTVLRAKTSVKVRLISSDTSKYYLDPINNKLNIVNIAFRYDRVWDYAIFLADREGSDSKVGLFLFLKDGVAMEKSEITNFNFTSTGFTEPVKTNILALYSSNQYRMKTMNITFQATKFYNQFQFKHRGLNSGKDWFSDISPQTWNSYFDITGDYTKTKIRHRVGLISNTDATSTCLLGLYPL